MKKTLLICLLAVFCAAAQGQANSNSKATPISGARVNNPVRDAAKTLDEKALLRAQVARLQQQVNALKQQVNQLLADAQKAKQSQPHCSSDLKTSISGLGSRDCWPNACDVVTGTCLQACVTGDDCQPGTSCWIQNANNPGQCVRP